MQALGTVYETLFTPSMFILFLFGVVFLYLAYYSFTRREIRVLGTLAGALGLLFVAAGGGLGIPVVLNNTQLGWLSTTQALPVWRLGFTSPGDSGFPVLYTGSTSPCSLNSGNGDNGSQVKAPDGCWNISQLSEYDVRIWGQVCNGSSDTAIFTAALASGLKAFVLPASELCIVGDLTLSGSTTFNCNNSTLKAAPGSKRILKKTGSAILRNCNFDDPNFYNKVATTLVGAVSPGATSFTVGDSTGFEPGMPINILLPSGAYWPTKIKPVGGVSGNTITITGKVPASATGIASIAAGGSGCTTAATLVAQGGRGAPVTMQATSVGGAAITGASINAPGFYETVPTNPVTATSHNQPSCVGVAVNLNTAGPSNGTTVEGSWGSLVVDQTSLGSMENITLLNVYAGVGVYATSTNVNIPTQQERYSNIRVEGAKFFAYWVGAGVNTTDWDDIWGWGAAHGASSFGVVGFMREYEQQTASFPSGGNHFQNFNLLLFENGTIAKRSDRDFYSHIINDTNRNYSWICDGCNNNILDTTIWSGQTGPSALSGVLGGGIGMYWGAYTGQDGITYPAAVNNMNGYSAGGNAADMYFADASRDGSTACGGFSCGASIFIGSPLTGGSGSMYMSGQTLAVLSGSNIVGGRSITPIGGFAAGNVYMGDGPGSSLTESDTLSMISGRHVMTSASILAENGPGAGQTWTANLRLYSGGVLSTIASCAIVHPATSCIISGPGRSLLDSDLIGWQIVPSGAAGTARFRHTISGL